MNVNTTPIGNRAVGDDNSVDNLGSTLFVGWP